jgi:N-methylhydantoinase B
LRLSWLAIAGTLAFEIARPHSRLSGLVSVHSGIAEVSMDPVTYSIIRHRLFRVTDEAVITLKHVSGSTTTNEGHDLMVGLYRADGSLLMGGLGFLNHMVYAAQACKVIIARFTGDINENDIFLLNDPYTAAAHTSDVYLISPIHYNGQLVAWSACFVHITDVGALNPGGFSPESRDVYTEGFSSPGLKLVADGELRQDVFDTILNMVRSPEMVSLDFRSMIACNNVAKERMLDLIAKYGYEAVDQAGAMLICESEQLIRARIVELPRGRWQAHQYMEVDGRSYKVCVSLQNDGNKLIFDFSGSSPQSDRAINCTNSACLGAVLAPLFPLVCHDAIWNEGIIRAVEIVTPGSSIVSCTRPAPVSVATIGAIQSVRIAASVTISKMLIASEKYRHEASAAWHANSFAIFLFGQNQHQRNFIGQLTEVFGGAGGARTFADGVDIGGLIANPISRVANVETLERNFPIRYLFRRRRINSGGAGKYRGGTGMELAIVPHDAPDGGVRFVISGKGQKHPMTDGLAGGYSGSRNRYIWAQGTDSLCDAPEMARSVEELPGPKQDIAWGVFPLMNQDVLYVATNGGGGYLDPLERDPVAVLEDVRNRAVSREAARSVYGTVLDGDAVDAAATAELRRALVAKRSGPKL